MSLHFALVGNQNCGKTTLFNQLTGANRHVGNFPGVTVDAMEGEVRGKKDAFVADLPGIYSLSPYTDEEVVTRDFIVTQSPDCIINIVDATNIERNLYLTLQLMDMNTPMVIALNMMDEVRENGGFIKAEEMSKLLSIPVIPISAVKNEGVSDLIDAAISVASTKKLPDRKDFCSGAVHRTIHAIAVFIEDHAIAAGVPPKFAATKIAEGDTLMLQTLKLSENEKETLEHTLVEMENELDTDRKAAIADMRYSFIEELCLRTVTKPHENKQHKRSVKIDAVLTNKYLAIPLFLIIIFTVFAVTFGFIGSFFTDLLNSGFEILSEKTSSLLTQYGMNSVVISLVCDGIITGLGSVVSFLPTILILFFFLSLLEDTGYMARVAFVMDRPLRKLGLSGKSFVPLLLGFGCTVPAVMSARTLSSERDRRMTILLVPFMSCSAKLPIYSVLVSYFFPKSAALVMICLYVFGIILGILSAILFQKTLFSGNPVPFVMELPNYRLPGFKSVMRLMWDKAKDFLQRAFTVIFLATLLIWFLQSFDLKLNPTTVNSDSILAQLGRAIAPAFKPLGFTDWRVPTSLITGISAKEAVISTLTLLCGSDSYGVLFTVPSILSFLTFTLIYTPCIAAIKTVKNEMKSVGWTVLMVVYQCSLAYLVSFIVYKIACLFC